MPVVPPPMSITVAPSSRSSATRVDRPAAIGAETSSAISRSQRRNAGGEGAQRGAGGVDHMQPRVRVVAMQSARIGDACGIVDGEASAAARGSVSRPPPSGARAAFVHHAL